MLSLVRVAEMDAVVAYSYEIWTPRSLLNSPPVAPFDSAMVVPSAVLSLRWAWSLHFGTSHWWRRIWGDSPGNYTGRSTQPRWSIPRTWPACTRPYHKQASRSTEPWESTSRRTRPPVRSGTESSSSPSASGKSSSSARASWPGTETALRRSACGTSPSSRSGSSSPGCS